MSKMHIDNESATETFASAYEASQEPTPRARRRLIGIETTAQLFARERLLDAAEQDSELAIIDGLDKNARELHEISTRPARYLDLSPVHDDHKDEYALMAKHYGANSDIAMSDFIEFGGTVDSSKLFKKSILSESEQEIVSKYADDPDCNVPVNPMKETFTKPETRKQIVRHIRNRFPYLEWYPRRLEIAVAEEMEDVQRTFVPKAKYVPVKPALEPVDQDERREARDLSREFQRRSSEDLYADGMRNRYSYNLDRRLRSQYTTSIRYQSWSEQLPWCGIPYFEQTFFGYTDGELDEAWECDEEEDLRSELAQWANDLESEEYDQRLDYLEEARQQHDDEAYELCHHRMMFIRDYNRRARQDDELFEAMRDYSLEITLMDDLIRLDSESELNDSLFGVREKFDIAV